MKITNPEQNRRRNHTTQEHGEQNKFKMHIIVVKKNENRKQEKQNKENPILTQV